MPDSETPLLPRIKSPQDLRRIPEERLPRLCDEIRDFLIASVGNTGGHLASNLGTVELTVALHYVFDTPHDKILWDVGHQSYAHKIITGRADRMHTLRKFEGLSGFPSADESEYDVFTVGHAGTSISSAIGMCEASFLAGETRKVVAVIGDGSMTAGMAFEGLNHIGRTNRNPIIVLNDNEMSIEPNVGAMSRFLSRKLVSKTALNIRQKLKSFLEAMGPLGEDVLHFGKRLEDSTMGLLSPGHLFEALGFIYVGPLEGHKVAELVETFRDVKNYSGPVLVHVITKKGKGYAPAENDPSRYHGVSKFDPKTGIPAPSPSPPRSYTDVFADALVKMAARDTSIVGVSAAMLSGTGLEKLMKTFPDRCYDVGIAEQHAVTFAAGLAKSGFKPVVAIYSTFLQRAYDQIVHDVLLQRLPVVFALDRGGLVGADGPTHHGVFDIAYLRHLPGIVLMAPKDEAELQHMLFSAVSYERPVALRYPRGGAAGKLPEEFQVLPFGKGELLQEGKDAVIVAYGWRVPPALEAARRLAEEGILAAVINARFAKPLDEDLIAEWAAKTGHVVTVEDGAAVGGFGAAVLEMLNRREPHSVRTRIVGLPDRFVEHGTQGELFRKYGLDEAGIASAVRNLLGRKARGSLEVVRG